MVRLAWRLSIISAQKDRGGVEACLDHATSLQTPKLAHDPDVDRLAIGNRDARCRPGDAYLNSPPAPKHRERYAAPCRRQSGTYADLIAAEVKSGEAKHDRLPHPSEPGDSHAARAVRIERAATNACMPALSELPWVQRGS